MEVWVRGFVSLLIVYYLATYIISLFGVYDLIIEKDGYLRSIEYIRNFNAFVGFAVFPFFYLGAWLGAKKMRNQHEGMITEEMVKHVKYWVTSLTFFGALVFASPLVLAAIFYGITLTQYLVKKWLPVTATETTTISPHVS